MHLSEPGARRWRVLVLALGMVVVAVVVGRGIYELALGLQLLGGAGVEPSAEQVSGVERESDEPADEATDDGADPEDSPSDDGEVPSAPPDDVPDAARAAHVERVVDGDTIAVRLAEPTDGVAAGDAADAADSGAGAGSGAGSAATEPVRVRLLNIDAPELDHPERGEDCGAVEATRLVETLIPPGTVVWLVADVEDRDPYDRLLRGVYARDGTFVNAEVVRRGWARVVLFEPNDRFHGELLPLEEQARRADRGAWAACDGIPS